tara:strand:- start:4387 stop:4842 length:456 start_codon:yes stop_codon:yes gene_type:complete
MREKIMDVIFDVDGTLMDIEHRRHFVTQRPKDFDAFRDPEVVMQDTPNKEIFALAKALKDAGNRIIVSTGRNKRQRATTLKQLMMNGLVFDAMYMRGDTDFRPDDELKKEFLIKMKEDGFNPVMAVDDRQQVVDMFRAEGLRVLQVDKGDF